MYAVIETGGKQYRVTEGDVLFIERLNGNPGDGVRFEKILACSNETETDFGRPYVDGASVEGKILGHGKNKKIVIFKYKAKKGYRKKQGHRQPYSKVRVERIISDKFGVASFVDDSLSSDNISGADTDIIIDAVNTAIDESSDADDYEDISIADTDEISAGGESAFDDAEDDIGENDDIDDDDDDEGADDDIDTDDDIDADDD